MAAHETHGDGRNLHQEKLSPDELATVIKEIGIPPRPAILQHLSDEMRKPEPDYGHMAQLLERDVSLSAGLLKTVNAPYYGLRQKVRNVREALLLLGLAKASRTIAGLALRQIFTPSQHLERFWDASDRTAQLSGWLVQEMGTRHGVLSEDAHTFALFRDCGIPILLRRFPEYRGILLDANKRAEMTFTDVEDRSLPTNHTVVGSIMARGWYLPELTCAAIQHHHDSRSIAQPPSTLARASQYLVALAQLAEYLLQQSTGLNRTREWEKLGPACLAVLDLDDTGIPGLQLRAGAFMDSLEEI